MSKERSETRTVELVSTVLVRTKYTCMYELCSFSDSAYKLNALTFAFKLSLYNIKISMNFISMNLLV